MFTSEMASNGLDLVPFAGSGKMVVESVAGKTMAGSKLNGKERIVHGAMGAGCLALDFTGVEEIRVVGKGVSIVKKVGTKLTQKGAVKGARIFTTTARFMAKHPELTAQAEKFAEAEIEKQIRNVKAYRKQAA